MEKSLKRATFRVSNSIIVMKLLKIFQEYILLIAKLFGKKAVGKNLETIG